MWKETDNYYSKRDDDSAIGDSANNSAGEESVNSRRKSSTSDETDDVTIQQYANLTSKVGKKMPECLLKDSDESVENCIKMPRKQPGNRQAKSKRVIRILPASAVFSRDSIDGVKPRSKPQMNTAMLEAKLQQLLHEMKKLRELDHDILRKFSSVNESIEEVRCKLESDITLTEDEASDDVIMTLTESRSSDWEDDEFSATKEDDGMKFVVPVMKAPASYATLTFVKRSKKANIASSSYESGQISKVSSKSIERKKSAQQNHDNVANSKSRGCTNSTCECIHSEKKLSLNRDHQASSNPTNRSIAVETLNQHNYFRFKSPHPASDVWMMHENRTNSPDDSYSGREVKALPQKRRSSASVLPLRPSNSLQQHQALRSKQDASSFRNRCGDDSRWDSHRQWLFAEKRQIKSATDFSNQRKHSNVSDASQTSNRTKAFRAFRQQPFSKSTDSTGSLTSPSSFSATSPVHDQVFRSASNKWNHTGSRKSWKLLGKHDIQLKNSESNGGEMVATSNYKPANSHPRFDGVMSRDRNLIHVPYKHSSSDTVGDWVRTQQDDITYL